MLFTIAPSVNTEWAAFVGNIQTQRPKYQGDAINFVTLYPLVCIVHRMGRTCPPRLSLLSYALKSLLNLTSVLQSEGAASATATHSQIQNPVWNVNIGNGCSLNSKILLQIQQTFECVWEKWEPFMDCWYSSGCTWPVLSGSWLKRYDSLEDLHKSTISVRGAAAVLLGRKSRSGRSGVGGSQERAKTDARRDATDALFVSVLIA